MRLYYGEFELNLKAKEDIHLPEYKGSTFRGGFGVAFKRIVCPLKGNECSGCMLVSSCVYARVFESMANEQPHPFGRVRTIPRPFIIEPPLEKNTVYNEGATIRFNLILIGKATEYLPYFIYTFETLGDIGIGKGRGKYILESVVDKTSGKLIYNHSTRNLQAHYEANIHLEKAIHNVLNSRYSKEPQRLTLRFLTPTRIKAQRKLTMDITFELLVKQLLRRLFLLWYFHCSDGKNNKVHEKDFHKKAIELAKGVKTLGSGLQWVDWERYSHRQRQKLKLGGFTGQITYEGVIEPFLPFIRAAEVVHIGKGTTFGLGKFVAEA